jgi:predicted thioesterase
MRGIGPNPGTSRLLTISYSAVATYDVAASEEGRTAVGVAIELRHAMAFPFTFSFSVLIVDITTIVGSIIQAKGRFLYEPSRMRKI